MSDCIFNAIAKREFTLPETVYILGSGPNAEQGIGKIPHDATVICLNGMVRFRPRCVWMVFDRGALKSDWWGGHGHEATRIFGEEFATELSSDVLNPIVPHYHFVWKPILWKAYNQEPGGRDRDPLVWGSLRGQCSIAGCAVQLAAFCKVKTLFLCGIDMQGQAKYNGEWNPGGSHAGVWGVAERLSWLIASMKRFHGMQTYTMTDTALDIPMAK